MSKSSWFIILLIFTSSCHLEKRHYRKGFYFQKKSILLDKGALEEKELSESKDVPLNDRITEKHILDSIESPPDDPENVRNQIPIVVEPLATNVNSNDVTNEVIAFNPDINIPSHYKFQSLVHSNVESEKLVHGIQNQLSEDEKLKWYEIVLIIILVAMGLACFGAIIVFGAETPLLIGILLIFPGLFIFGQSGDGGIVFSVLWGLLYILSYFLIFPNASYLVMIIFGIISMLVSLLIGFLIDERS